MSYEGVTGLEFGCAMTVQQLIDFNRLGTPIAAATATPIPPPASPRSTRRSPPRAATTSMR
jgi:hypothetical protein